LIDFIADARFRIGDFRAKQVAWQQHFFDESKAKCNLDLFYHANNGSTRKVSVCVRSPFDMHSQLTIKTEVPLGKNWGWEVFKRFAQLT